MNGCREQGILSWRTSYPILSRNPNFLMHCAEYPAECFCVLATSVLKPGSQIQSAFLASLRACLKIGQAKKTLDLIMSPIEAAILGHPPFWDKPMQTAVTLQRWKIAVLHWYLSEKLMCLAPMNLILLAFWWVDGQDSKRRSTSSFSKVVSAESCRSGIWHAWLCIWMVLAKCRFQHLLSISKHWGRAIQVLGQTMIGYAACMQLSSPEVSHWSTFRVFTKPRWSFQPLDGKKTGSTEGTLGPKCAV